MDDGWCMMDERLMTDMYDWYADWWIWLTHMIKDQYDECHCEEYHLDPWTRVCHDEKWWRTKDWDEVLTLSGASKNNEGWMMTFDKCIINDETWMTGRMIHPWLMNTCCWWWSVDPQLAATKAPLGLWCLLSGSDHLSYGRWYFQALPSTLECDGNRTEIEGMDTSYISEHVSHSSESRNFLRVDSYQWTDIWPTPHYPTGFEKVVCDVGKFPPKWPNRYLEVEEDGKITIFFSELQLSDLPVG